MTTEPFVGGYEVLIHKLKRDSMEGSLMWEAADSIQRLVGCSQQYVSNVGHPQEKWCKDALIKAIWNDL